MSRARVPLLLAALVVAPPALARAPEPARPVPPALYSGRWYEVARTPNDRERGCLQVTSDFSGMTGTAFLVAQTCQRGHGASWVNRARATITPGTANTKFTLGFLAGLIQQEYWILDVSPQGDWAILATPGGHYVWLLSRHPALAGPARGAALARIAALGYATDKLEMH